MRVFSTKANRVVSIKTVDGSYKLKHYEHSIDTNEDILFKIYDAATKTFSKDSETDRLLDEIKALSNSPVSVKVSPVEFKLLWTSPERIALKTLRETDSILDDFFSIVEDIRLTEVNLGLESTKQAVSYAVAQLVSNGTINQSESEVRIEEILSGQLK